MKKILIILSLFVLTVASSASATIYKWVDKTGTVYFADEYSNVDPDYRDNVKKITAPNPGPLPARVSATASDQSTVTTTQVPPIAQPLIAEGDFAVMLAEALQIGSPQSEEEAESMLAFKGIQPRNGWIADYPVTPDIVGELQDAVVQAADSGKLAMKKDDAIRAFNDLTSQQGLSLNTDQRQNTETNVPQDYGDYSNPTVINNYYYEEGPPVVTYYTPPPDYGYLYSWVAYPFWCSGFFFPGFFVLNDFDRFVVGHHFHHGHEFNHRITNHFKDPRTHAFQTVDPKTRGTRISNATHTSPHTAFTNGFRSEEARKGATSIFNRSFQGERSGPTPTVKRPARGGTNTAGVRTFSQPRGIGNSQTPPTGTVRSSSTPPSATFNRSPRSAERPADTRIRSLSAPQTTRQTPTGSFQGTDFRSYPRTFNVPTRSFNLPPSGNGGGISGFTTSRSFGSHTGGLGHMSPGNSFGGHGGAIGRF
jgi:hypothetical protein